MGHTVEHILTFLKFYVKPRPFIYMHGSPIMNKKEYPLTMINISTKYDIDAICACWEIVFTSYFGRFPIKPNPLMNINEVNLFLKRTCSYYVDTSLYHMWAKSDIRLKRYGHFQNFTLSLAHSWIRKKPYQTRHGSSTD